MPQHGVYQVTLVVLHDVCAFVILENVLDKRPLAVLQISSISQYIIFYFSTFLSLLNTGSQFIHIFYLFYRGNMKLPVVQPISKTIVVATVVKIAIFLLLLAGFAACNPHVRRVLPRTSRDGYVGWC